MPGLLEFLRLLALRHGYVIERESIEISDALRTARLLRARDINLVLDVGANEGQWASQIRSRGYTGRIVSYEPLVGAHARLVSLAEDDPLWEIAPRMALGAATGEAEINVSANLVSSSLLMMKEAHLSAAPDSEFIRAEKTPIQRLDEVAAELFSKAGTRAFLKMEVQGFETAVLAGAAGVLPHITGIQAELSHVELYEGQSLFAETAAHIEGLGFELCALLPGFSDQETGRMLQVDGVFFRGSAAAKAQRSDHH
jgi:FkbM family methyltransferase